MIQFLEVVGLTEIITERDKEDIITIFMGQKRSSLGKQLIGN